MRLICFHTVFENWTQKKTICDMPGLKMANHEMETYKKSTKQWNDLLPIDLFHYRNFIQQIHLKSIRAAEMQEVNSIDEIMKFENFNDSDIVIPSDDDDFYHPRIKEYFSKKNADVFVWDCFTYNYGHKSLSIHKFNPNEIYIASTYAFRIRWLKRVWQFLSKKDTQDSLLHHWVPHNIVKNNYHYIPVPLSLYNYHIGTTSRLRCRLFKKAPTCLWPRNRDIWPHPYLKEIRQLYHRMGLYHIPYI